MTGIGLTRRLVRMLLIWVLIFGILPPLAVSAHGIADADVDCTAVLLAPDGIGVRLQDSSARPSASHCVYCHWCRTIGSVAPPGQSSNLPVPVPARFEASRIRPCPHHTPRGAWASRAPPAGRHL